MTLIMQTDRTTHSQRVLRYDILLGEILQPLWSCRQPRLPYNICGLLSFSWNREPHFI